ncbi:MAG: hypothetical protein D6705_18765 [Deltaproteobacteria bacterium]|nr:MAG: hypothetical protein D6705_18765 [Deltaproteobacteria bacterium]
MLAAAAGCTAHPTTASGDLSAGTGGTATAGASDASTALPPSPPYDLPLPPVPACDAVDVSLVVDPKGPYFDADSRIALGDFLDTLTERTGATVRVLAGPARPELPLATCPLPLGDDADGPVFVWGRDFVPNPAARDVLDCVLDQMLELPDAADGEAAMFSGLLFPILERPDWPSEDAVALSILLAAGDDEEANMYARSGLAGEAYVRLAGGGDRRRVAVLAVGKDADELPMFAHTASERSEYAEGADLAEILEDFTDAAEATCRDHDLPPPPPPPSGCTGIDVLFVIDGSYSMLDEQNALRGVDGPPVFAEFTDVLLAELDEVESIHVGVVSSQPGDVSFHTHMDQPEVPPSPATDCGLDPAVPYLVAPSPTFAEDFACIAATKANTEEYTAKNAADALATAPTGFLRDDSVVFVVMLTDEDTQEWLEGVTRLEVRDTLLEAVGGRLDRLYVLSVHGDPGTFEAPKTVCGGPYGTAVPARRLTDIVWSLREQGSTSDVCAGDLAGTFDDVLAEVVRTCESFVPEG